MTYSRTPLVLACDIVRLSYVKYVRNLPTLFQRDSRRKALAVSKKIDCNRSMFPKVHSYVFALLSYCDYNIFSDFPIQFYGKLGVMCVVTSQ